MKSLAKIYFRAFLICAMVTFAGCRSVGTSSLDKVGLGVGKTKEHADLFFSQVNDIARQASVEHAIKSENKDLSDQIFAVAVEPEAIAAWDYAFEALYAYVTAVQQLIAPARSQPLADAAVGLAKQLSEGKTNATLSPGLATAFTELGRAVVDAKAQKDALDIMQKTDPAFRAVTTQMATAIRDVQRNSVSAAFDIIARPQREAWGKAVLDSNQDAKRQILEEYAELLDRRDQMLTAADALSASLLLLADAHTEAAQGVPASAASILTVIEKRLDESKVLYKQFDDIKKANRARNKPATRSTTNPS